MKISDAFIFFNSREGLVAVDTKKQKYFLINSKCLERIFQWIRNPKDTEYDEIIDNDLVKSGLLESQQNEAYSPEWHGDQLSWFFYNSIKNNSDNIPYLNKEDLVTKYVDMSRNACIPSARFKSPTETDGISLPSPNIEVLDQTSLLAALKKRKTSRIFYKDPIDIETLSVILFTSFGYIHGKTWDDFNKNNMQQLGFRKSSPSATGIQACDAFVSILNVKGISEGIYRYDAETHKLFLIKDGMTDKDLSYYVCDQFWVEGIAAGIFIAVDMRLVWAKDKKVRAFPIAYLEAGHISQTIQLCATSVGLKTWITGAFRDEVISEHLGIGSNYILPVAFVGFGHGSDSSIPLEFISPSA